MSRHTQEICTLRASQDHPFLHIFTRYMAALVHSTLENSREMALIIGYHAQGFLNEVLTRHQLGLATLKR